MKKLLFTDLDGTLLDLETYSAEKVSQHVRRLKALNVSIIFCSSKTWDEQEHYLYELGLNEPVIVENGSGIFLPENFSLEFSNESEIIHGKKALLLGKMYEDVVHAINKANKKHGTDFHFYHNLSIEQIAAITGLSIAGAEKAKNRDFSETIFNADINTDSYRSFEKTLANLGFQCMPGSRYVTISGIESNKGKAVNLLIEAYKEKYSEVQTIGIGDSRNDLEMLQAVQFPYLVKRPDNTWANISADYLVKVSAVGPDGWNIMAEEILLD